MDRRQVIKGAAALAVIPTAALASVAQQFGKVSRADAFHIGAWMKAHPDFVAVDGVMKDMPGNSFHVNVERGHDQLLIVETENRISITMPADDHVIFVAERQ